MMENNRRKMTSSDKRLLTLEIGCRGITSVQSVLKYMQFVVRDESRQLSLDVMRLLLRETDNPPEIEWYRGPIEGFSMFQQSTDPFYYQRPLADRVEVAFDMAMFTFNSEPALMQLALGESITSAQAASLVDTCGRTVLHTVVFKLAKKTSYIIRGDVFGECDNRDGKDIIKT